QHLIGQGHTVLLAAEGSAAQLLRERFPQLSILPLKGYRISYARSSATFMLKLLLQLPKMLGAIRREHRWLQRIVADFQIDLVISDNRYGLYHNKVQSVIMTHQLQIISGWGRWRSEEHTSELQSRENLVCRLLLEKKKETNIKRLKKQEKD